MTDQRPIKMFCGECSFYHYPHVSCNTNRKFDGTEHPYISALEELLSAYCKEREFRPTSTISKEDAQYAMGIKRHVKRLISAYKIANKETIDK